MRSRSRSSRADAAAVVALLAAAAVGCASGEPELAAGTAPDRVVTGPQGTVGQFAVECRFDRFRADDPIVLPGRAGESHLHQFFGAVGVSTESTYDDLLAADTTCDQHADTASYWTPSLIVGGQPVEPLRAVAYYRAGPDVDPATVVPYPPGLMMVAGDHTAIDPQPESVVAWTCGTGGTRATEPPDCSRAESLRGVTLRMLVTFPDCWDGERRRSPIPLEPSLHVAYSSEGRCPSSHPTPIPQLQLAVDWPVPDTVDGLALSSGDIHSGHADFWNAWNQDKLEREVTACIHHDLPCTIGG